MAALTDRVSEFEGEYSGHDALYSELKNKCNTAQRATHALTLTAKEWHDKLEGAGQGLVAYEAALVYDKIADAIIEANNRSLASLQEYVRIDKELDEAHAKCDEMKSRSDEQLLAVNVQVARREQAHEQHSTLAVRYGQLDSKARELTRTLDKVDAWVTRTAASARLLDSLDNELSAQQAALSGDEREADELVRRIEALESLRNSGKDEQQQQQLHGDFLVGVIQDSLQTLMKNAPDVNNTIARLQDENTFDSELEAINNEILQLEQLIINTRQIAKEIRVAMHFNESSVVQLKVPADLAKPSLSTTLSLYVKTSELNAPIGLCHSLI